MANEKVKKPFYKKWWVWVIAVVVVLFFLVDSEDDEEMAEDDQTEMNLIKNGDSDSESESNDMENESEEASAEEEDDSDEYHFDGDELVTEDFKIEITDHKVLQPGEGNNHSDEPIIGFWYDTTVNEDVEDADIDPSTAWITTITAIQDNDPDAINELNVGILPDEEHRDSQDQTIKPGGTVSSSMSYEITDDKTPITLIAEDNMFTDDELGSQEYNID